MRGTGDARLGAMLKAMRRADGRGLKESAHACGVSVSAMSAYERGEAQQRHLGHLAKLVDETRQQHAGPVSGRGSVADAPMRRHKAGRRSVCCRGRTGGNALLPARPRPSGGAQAQRLQGRARGNGELADLKKQLKDLASDLLDARVDRGSAAVVNQILNTVIRAIEQERKMRELEEMAQRLEALEEVLKGRKAG